MSQTGLTTTPQHIIIARMDTQDTMRANIKQTGVYEIFNLTNGKRYVGSAAKSFVGRWRSHRNLLRKGKHHSRHLQGAWDKCGEAAFEFRILEVTPPDEAVAREQFWIDLHQAANDQHGYNIAPTAGSGLGIKWTPESCKAQSERVKKQWTPETRESARQRGKSQFSTVEARRANGERTKARITPESRKAQSELAKRTHGTPEARKANSERAKARFANQEARKAASERTKAQFSTPESRKAASEWNKAHRGTPEARKEQRERAKAQFSTPEARKHQSEVARAIQTDPVKKAAILAKFRATLAAKKLARQSCRQMELFT